VLLVTEQILVVFVKEAKVLCDGEDIARRRERGELSGLTNLFFEKVAKELCS